MISWSVNCRDNTALKEMRFSNRWQKQSGAKGVCHGTYVAAVLRRGGKGFATAPNVSANLQLVCMWSSDDYIAKVSQMK